MPLRFTLKPYERLIINGAAIRNGGRSADFLVETHCKFLRESEIIHEREADTACKRLCVTLQVIHLSDDAAAAETLFYEQANAILGAMPSAAAHVAAITEALDARQTHKAIKAGKRLVAYEADLLKRVAATPAATGSGVETGPAQPAPFMPMAASETPLPA
jgi:flagellar biosynthesis repressor protein FlbT